MKASLGSIEYITSLYPSEDESSKIKEAVRTSVYGVDFVRAALSVNNKKAIMKQAHGELQMLQASKSASAIAVADVLLLQDNISGVPFCVAKSRQTTLLIKQNVALALSSIAFASLTSRDDDSGEVLDALASCRSIAFDKTGTLTTGDFVCKAIEPIHGHMSRQEKQFACCKPTCETEALAVAAAMEKGTTHPIGRAFLDHSSGKDLPSISVESFENLPGRGVFATLSSG
ncbi:unnamed protein product [Cuscuta campestris]|uniref:Uncharacterized protein n=1 Tax=Cuscuta campestris TaxID=132261 RepID=A0A484LXI5_9ASTE|nr:unnamed protein product [Cuscuta campestris]